MIKLKLSISDRLFFGFLRPPQSNMASQDIAEELEQRVRIPNKEKSEIKMKISDSGQITWDGKSKDKEFEFSDFEMKHLKEQLTRLDNQEKVTPQMYSLCKKIQAIKVAEEINDKKEKK